MGKVPVFLLSATWVFKGLGGHANINKTALKI